MGALIHIENYNVHNHVDTSEILSILNLIKLQNHKIMAQQEKFDVLIGRLNVVTNDIAADLKLLKDQIAAGTISDESLANLDTNITALETLGASTENPVPPVEG